MVHPPAVEGEITELVRGPNIKPLPKFEPLSNYIYGPVLLKMENNVSTDEILPAGTARDDSANKGSFIIAGANYGQGSSREHAAIAPNYLGIKGIIAKSYARIHRKNLINFGILPLVFWKEEHYKNTDQEDILECNQVIERIEKNQYLTIVNKTKNLSLEVECPLSEHEREILLEGGLINYLLKKRSF